MEAIIQNAYDVLERLKAESLMWGAPPKLVAVTKQQPPEAINLLIQAGIFDIGENRAQEIIAKYEFLDPNFKIQLIGRLQTNKVKYIINKVCQIQSLDRMELALKIDRYAQAQGLVMPVLIQISPAGEAQKGGIPPDEAHAFIRRAAKLKGLKVNGLMAVMPISPDEAYLSGLFLKMRALFDQLRQEAVEGVTMAELSMGMSHDYVLAARQGATMVRVGSAIFGPRQAPVAYC